MDFKNEQFKLGRLFGYMVALKVENDGDITFEDWINRSNDEINWYRIDVKPEMLCDFMEIYCGYANSNYANIIEFDGIKYCLVGEYELIDNQLENGDGIVCINEEGKFDFYEDDRFMNEIINGDNEKLDRLEKFIQNN
jgi:hypothetical protein